MFVYIRSAAFVIVVTQKQVLLQSKNVYGNPISPSFYSILLDYKELLNLNKIFTNSRTSDEIPSKETFI